MHWFFHDPKRVIAACSAIFLFWVFVAMCWGGSTQSASSNAPESTYSRSIVQVVSVGLADAPLKSLDQKKAEEQAYEMEWRDVINHSRPAEPQKPAGQRKLRRH